MCKNKLWIYNNKKEEGEEGSRGCSNREGKQWYLDGRASKGVWEREMG